MTALPSSFRFWIGLGHAIEARSPSRGVRFVGLVVGAATLAIGLSALPIAAGVQEGRELRAQQILPRTASMRSEATSLIAFRGFTQLDNQGITVLLIWPLRADAQPPPGVARWPSPGEAVVSPAVAELLDRRPNLFGPVVGKIGFSGLETPRDRRVYLRPTLSAFDPSKMTLVRDYSGAGKRGSSYGLAMANTTEPQLVIQMLIAGLVVPALIAIGVAAGVGADERALTTRRLRVLGAGRRHLLLLDAGGAWRPMFIGLSVGAIVVGMMCATDVSFPLLDTVIPASDVRRRSAYLMVALLASPALSLATVFLVRQRPVTRKGRSAFSPAQRIPIGRSAVCIGAGFATIWLPAQGYTGRGDLVYVAGIAIFTITLPGLVAYVLASAGNAAVRVGHANGWSGVIVGGRQLSTFPLRTARLVSGICVAILLAGQVQLYAGILGSQYNAARTVRAELGTSILVSTGSQRYDKGWTTFLSELPRNVAPLWLSTDPKQGMNAPTLIRGECSALRTLALPCSRRPVDLARSQLSPTARQVVSWLGGTGALLAQTTEAKSLEVAEQMQATLLLTSLEGKSLPRLSLQQRSYQQLGGGLDLEPLGQDWVTAASVLKNRADWITAIGSFALLILAIATATALAGDVISGGRKVAPLALLYGHGKWFTSMTTVLTALPLITAAVMGVCSYLGLSVGFAVNDDSAHASLLLAMSAFLVAAVVAAVMVPVANIGVRRQTAVWRPGQQ